jgi:DNA-binding LytR/AlgR family response regulator
MGSDNMNIAICYDKTSEYLALECHIQEYCNVLHLKHKICRFKSGAAFLDSFAKGRFQIAFMDIYMDGTNADGLDAAREIHRRDENCKIIFTTSSKDFAIDGYELAAVHYIVKPVSYEKVREALDRCRELIMREARYITVIANRDERQILLKNILYIEAVEKKLLIHTGDEIIPTYMSFEQIGADLDEAFLRCHKSYLVNMGHVHTLHKDFLMKNGDTVLIKKRDAKTIKEAFAKYKWDRMRGEM